MSGYYNIKIRKAIDMNILFINKRMNRWYDESVRAQFRKISECTQRPLDIVFLALDQQKSVDVHPANLPEKK
ncbi:MAG: hypothetical protein NMNS01_27880 [Nitrosomonas sp.]|nr:MAG: hypothetical protein NMNS01_27880 [Nitrosomonas sp.]